MITEDYCSFEIAKLLKEKGFNNPCLRVYDNKGIICIRYTGFDVPHDYFNRQLYLCPTHQMAIQWLREKGIECVVIPIWNTIGKQYRSYVLSDLGDKYKDNYDSYSDNISYEEAVEAALKYCLENLILL